MWAISALCPPRFMQRGEALPFPETLVRSD
jgi:hypothetical protein